MNQQGDIVYRFRHPWRNGKQAVVMDPMTFLSRLAALIPPPRSHVLSYYGVRGAAAARRELIVRPAEPYIDWARGLDDSGVVPDPESRRQ